MLFSLFLKELLLIFFLVHDSPFHKRTFSLPFGSVPLLPRRTSGGDSDWHLVTNCAKHSCAFPPLFASYRRHLNVCLTSCVSIAIISRRTLQTFAWRMCVGWGGRKKKKRKEKNAVNVALEPREPTALPRALSPPAPSLSVSTASRQLVGFFFFFFPSPVSFQTECNSLQFVSFFPHWEKHRGLSASQALK